MRIRPAQAAERDLLLRIAVESKAHWGYDREWVESWVHSDDFQTGLDRRETYVAEVERTVAGWTSAGWKDGIWWMDDLWVLPAFMRRRVGTTLVDIVVARGRELGASLLRWEADPHANAFYERLGARHVRDGERTRWSEPLPIYELRL